MLTIRAIRMGLVAESVGIAARVQVREPQSLNTSASCDFVIVAASCFYAILQCYTACNCINS